MNDTHNPCTVDTMPPEDAPRREPVIDPSPAHQAIEEVCAEYERRIADLEAERDELRRQMTA